MTNEIQIGPYTLCPVRCVNCDSLQACDIYQLGVNFKRKEGKICPLCSHSYGMDKNFIDMFYIDMKLMKFIFLNGQSSTILFDPNDKSYFHKLSFFTANTLKQRLREEGSIDRSNIYSYDMSVRDLDKSKTYLPFIDSKCRNKLYEKDPSFNINDHYIYVEAREKLPDDLCCPTCKTPTRSDRLFFHEQLERVLKAEQNILVWNGKEDAKVMQQVQNIASIRYYEDIPD